MVSRGGSSTEVQVGLIVMGLCWFTFKFVMKNHFPLPGFEPRTATVSSTLSRWLTTVPPCFYRPNKMLVKNIQTTVKASIVSWNHSYFSKNKITYICRRLCKQMLSKVFFDLDKTKGSQPLSSVYPCIPLELFTYPQAIIILICVPQYHYLHTPKL